MAEDNAPCSDLVQERLHVRMARRRIAELEAKLAKTEGDRDFWASDALLEVTRKWEAKDTADRWRRYAEHWRGRVRGASEAVRAAMGREKSAWAAWQVVTASLGRERERAEKAEAEREVLIRANDLGFRLAELEHRGVETAFALQEAQAGQERLATRVAELEWALLAAARALEEDAAVLRLRVARGEAPGPADLLNPTGAAENARAALSGTPVPYPRRRKAKPDLAQYQAELEAEIDLDRGVTGAKDLPTSGRW